jgi:hypothetical protein
MLSRKKKPVLYEVIRRSAAGQMARKPAEREPEPAAEAVHEPPKPRIVTSVEEASSVPEAYEPRRMVRVDRELVQLSLTWPVATVLSLAVLVALLLSFYAGWSTAPVGSHAGTRVTGAATDDFAAAAKPDGSSPAAPSGSIAVPPLRDAGSAKAAPVKPQPQASAAPLDVPFQPAKGSHYLVVQYFKRDRAEVAALAQQLLAENGVAAALTRRGQDYVLIATEPFLLDNKDPALRRKEKQRADALQAIVRKVGKQFVTKNGYSFDQCFFEEAK